MIYFAKTNPQATIPSKRDEDGAFDIYACFEEDAILLQPHETKLIPTGIASAFSSDYVAILKERGSSGSLGIGQRAGVIDSGYRGEWFVAMTNHNEVPMAIAKTGVSLPEGTLEYPYSKAVCQCLMVQVPKLGIEEISLDRLLAIKSERGTGALGSSGK
ncbi:MAG: dUTP pyrophosphatase [Turicibacter sp.]|nr:dUTP pyrophosphatase [Turicibacter sp.]